MSDKLWLVVLTEFHESVYNVLLCYSAMGKDKTSHLQF